MGANLVFASFTVLGVLVGISLVACFGRSETGSHAVGSEVLISIFYDLWLKMGILVGVDSEWVHNTSFRGSLYDFCLKS